MQVLTKTLPIDHQTSESLTQHFGDNCDPEKIKFMWIGHASCLVKLDGVTFLTDPMFSQRCSPTGEVVFCGINNSIS